MPSKKSEALDWIFSLAFSPSSPLFIQVRSHKAFLNTSLIAQFQAIKILIELTSLEPSIINSIVEMIVKTLESSQSDERSSWMCRIGLYTCNKLMKIVPDSHRSTLSRLIVPLCHFIPQQGEVSWFNKRVCDCGGFRICNLLLFQSLVNSVLNLECWVDS